MKIIVVAGARPNFMKVAPIIAAFERQRAHCPELQVLLVHTGQHYERRMSGEFFEQLGIPPPDINLQVGSGSHAQQTARVMMAFEETCLKERPDWVVVVGDVNSTMACSITARKLGIRVAHVEAGLRSRDMDMPEEINRLCTDAVSDLLFTTEGSANLNLQAEGVPPERIHFVGNTMIDSLLRHIEAARNVPLLEGLENGRYGVLTLHRPSNVDSPLKLQSLFSALNDIAEPHSAGVSSTSSNRAKFETYRNASGDSGHRTLRLFDLSRLGGAGVHDANGQRRNSGRDHRFGRPMPHVAGEYGASHHLPSRNEYFDRYRPGPHS